MTLDEAIIHAEEVYKTKRDNAEEARLQEQDKYADECAECAAEHRQLAEWLRELKAYKNKYHKYYKPRRTKDEPEVLHNMSLR